MKVVSISGLRGSGKTTLIRELMARLVSSGRTCSVIVNENGEVSYDPAFLNQYHIRAEYLRGG